MTSTGRPTPLREAARLWSLVIGPAGAVITALVTSGAISADQGSLLESGFTNADLLISAVIGLITWGSAIAGAFFTAKSAEPQVTPMIDPRSHDGLRLVPETPPHRVMSSE